MTYGFKTFKANGEIEWSFTGLSPRIHSSGMLYLPGISFSYTFYIPEITDPSEWVIVDIPYFNMAYNDYAYIKNFNISTGQISITVVGPFLSSGYLKYIIFKIK